MSIDVSGAQDALAAAFQTTTLTVKRDGVATTVACGCASKQLTLTEGDAVVVRSGFVISTHGTDTTALLPDERVTVARLPGRVLRIVGPIETNLGLTRSYQAVEVR